MTLTEREGNYFETKGIEISENSIKYEMPIGTSIHRVIGHIILKYKMVENEFVLSDISYSEIESNRN